MSLPRYASHLPSGRGHVFQALEDEWGHVFQALREGLEKRHHLIHQIAHDADAAADRGVQDVQHHLERRLDLAPKPPLVVIVLIQVMM